MNALWQDIRYALRQLRKSPGFTAVAVITLALGIGANATVFSFVNDFFLRPLTVKDPEQLVVVLRKIPNHTFPNRLSYPDYLDFRRYAEGDGHEYPAVAKTFSGLTACRELHAQLSVHGGITERMWLHAVSDNYFSLLGIQPFDGRLFHSTEGKVPGADPVIVLTYDFWRNHLSANSSVIGQTVYLNGLPFTVVGITPHNFHGASWGAALDGFIPATMIGTIMPAEKSLLSNRGENAFFVIGRLQANASLQHAEAAANDIIGRLQNDYPADHVPGKAVVVRESMSRPSPHAASFTPLIVSLLMGLVLLVLAIAVANVANLLYARAIGRERELAIRGALGASRWYLTRELLIESVLLALGAGVLGMIVSRCITPDLSRFFPQGMPPLLKTGVDWRTFVFTFGVSLVIGILAGLFPALAATRLNIVSQLKEENRAWSNRRHPLRTLLVIGQITISCVVLVCTGLTISSLQKLSHMNTGFQSGNLSLASFDLDMQHYDQKKGELFQTQLLEKVRALPGVRYASFAQYMPFEADAGTRSDISAEGQPATDNSHRMATYWQIVEKDFLKTMGISVIQGRGFWLRDDASAPRVAVITDAMAQRLWPNENPIGKRLMVSQYPVEVIGVIGDVRFLSMADQARPSVFMPLAQNYRGNLTMVVRTEQNQTAIASTLQRVVRELDPDIPLYNFRTMDQQIANSPLALMPLRIGSMIAAVQGAIALFLAAMGIYGLVSFSVRRRTHEIGIRLALGANRGDVFRSAAWQGLSHILIGLGAGMVIAIVISRLMSSVLYGISWTDPFTFGSVPLLIIVVAFLASCFPARRAAKVDPMVALRYE
jgi:predicted permease